MQEELIPPPPQPRVAGPLQRGLAWEEKVLH